MFKKYNSLRQVDRQKYVDKALNLCLPCKWVVQEKVHGANMSFIYDGDKVLVARRIDLVAEDEKFFNSKAVLAKYESKIIELYKHLNCKSLTVFGEIFGNGVFKQTFYSKEQDFYAFDIVSDDVYLDVDKCEELFEQFDFFYAKSLFKGTMAECFEYPNTFDSLLPKQLGNDHVEDNICEGTVIRPNTATFYNCGSRVIFKNRNEKYTEKTKTRKPKTTLVVPDEVKVIVEAATAYINENRIRSVLSKIGEVTQNDFGKVCGLLTKDVFEELKEDVSLGDMDEAHVKILAKQINFECGNEIRKHWLNIIDGQF
jgi:Rnl2 family RNA ligase